MILWKKRQIRITNESVNSTTFLWNQPKLIRGATQPHIYQFVCYSLLTLSLFLAICVCTMHVVNILCGQTDCCDFRSLRSIFDFRFSNFLRHKIYRFAKSFSFVLFLWGAKKCVSNKVDEGECTGTEFYGECQIKVSITFRWSSAHLFIIRPYTYTKDQSLGCEMGL